MYLSNKLLNNNQGRREGGKFIYKIMQKIVAKKRQCAKMGFYYRQRGQKCWHNSLEKFWRPTVYIQKLSLIAREVNGQLLLVGKPIPKLTADFIRPPPPPIRDGSNDNHSMRLSMT